VGPGTNPGPLNPGAAVATTMTLLQLRTAVRERADQVNSTFISDSELTSYIQQSSFELYDVLVQKYGDAYFVKNPPATITTDGTNEVFALPTDLYKLLGVDLQTSGAPNGWLTLRPFNMAERNRYWRPNAAPIVGFTSLRYRLAGSNLWLTPLPAASQTLRVWYVPRLTTYTGDSDTLDGISGWTEYVIVDAAIKCMVKEESDPSALMAQKAALLKRIEEAAGNRDEGAPPTVSDVSGSDWTTGWPGYGGFGY
jgi:hypothetical protein